MKKIRRSAKMITGMSMASMSDIAFLLIIFFMVTSVFTLREGLHLTLPDTSRTPVIVPAKNIVTILLPHEGPILYNGAPTEEKLVPIKLSEAMADNPRLAVLLQISPRTAYYRSVSLIDRIRMAGITRLTLRMM